MRRRVHPEHHTNLLLVNFNTLDERSNGLPAGEPIGFVQPIFDACGKLIKSTQDQR